MPAPFNRPIQLPGGELPEKHNYGHALLNANVYVRFDRERPESGSLDNEVDTERARSQLPSCPVIICAVMIV